MSLKEQITKNRAGLKIWHQERAILETTELVCEIMEEQNISRVELAKRMGVTKGFVTQLLDGTANMTLRTVSDVFVALGYEFHPTRSPLDNSHDEGVVDFDELKSLVIRTPSATVIESAGTSIAGDRVAASGAM